MIPFPSGVRVWLAKGPHRHEKGLSRFVAGVEEDVAARSPQRHLFVFRGRRGDLIKVLWHDGQGACLLSKRLERGRFIWPSPADGVITITAAQLGYLLEGIDCRMPQRTWRPASSGRCFCLVPGGGCDSIAVCRPLNCSLPTLPLPMR
ncbi:IS66 family insertion sequence element accessory protein TnpB [Oricola cellulosilytica]|uniref:Transposase n=1 Tax=Oricola cellulosilytica TaxID=1429082 RepID=A0A4R0P5Z2_9HYPH|nr:transposase [Oricola cellulosilytica]